MELFDTFFVCFVQVLVVSVTDVYKCHGKITTAPRLFSEHLLQDENKDQIMNVHTKWNCVIPILSGLVKY